MDKTSQAFEKLIGNFVHWAGSQDDIRMAFVLGSRARTDHPADEWSDLDLAVVAKDIHPYIASAEWVRQIGEPKLSFVEGTGDGRSLERRVLFDGGLDVDFALMPLEMVRALTRTRIPPDVADLFRRGVRVLLDKDQLIPDPEQLAAAWQPPAPPAETEFLEVINDFWYHAVWTAKHLRRGELWWAKAGCDIRLKELLRRMLEWHARAVHGADHDTWLRGRFLEEWVDDRALRSLKDIYAHYDETDLWHALEATMNLFEWVSRETAQKWDYSLPKDGIEFAQELTSKISHR